VQEEEGRGQSVLCGKMSEKRGEETTPPPPLPHELTAEWTVRAQLTFARGGEAVQKEYNVQEPLHPVRVVYKWCTPEAEHEKVSKVINE